MTEPVRFTDPVVGDDLILVPLTQNQAFSAARTMADFWIIPAVQGLVIKPLTEKMIVRPVTDGIEITTEGGLHLSSPNDTGAAQQSTQKARAAEEGKSLFDFAAWRGKPEEDFSQTRQRLQQTIVDVQEIRTQSRALGISALLFCARVGRRGHGTAAIFVQASAGFEIAC